MKKLNWLFLLLLSVVFLTSCGEDEEEQSEENLGILGTWDLKSFQYSGSTQVDYGNGFVVGNPFVAEAINIDMSITFNDNNTYTTQGDYSIVIAPDIEDGDDLAITIDFQNFFESGNWRREGNELIFNENQLSGNEIGRSTIIELTQNRMVVELEYRQEETDPAQGITVISEVAGVYVVEKR
ncbi:lipocalin family protein [Bernardetia sp.]|uniref:lipocalin family protein n=1 Tax=Bernardetia sp. TaxID=1937974 RepID=UPI0025C64947|nr:lipocalin family protein [Bernardetia sp.]